MHHSSATAPPISLTSDEIVPLREAMRDVQESVSSYYLATGSGADLGKTVRTFLNDAQTLNDLMSKKIGDAGTFRSLFSTTRHARAPLIEAVKFARNIVQHVLHVVRPSSQFRLVGGSLGFRVYAEWDAVPADVVSKLWPVTQALEPAYKAELEGMEVTGTMMSVLRFYAEVAPQIVHRDPHGEWTGFPLISQPGVTNPLHPEEPADMAAARAWMDNRRPGGDCRVVCGQVTVDGVAYAYGHTFTRGLSFAPFVETVQQANRDIERGFPYLDGPLLAHVEDVTDRYPAYHQGAVIQSRGALENWTVPLTELPPREDWSAPGVDRDSWAGMVRLEASTVFSEFSFTPRRARRLNALGPTG